MTEKQYKVERCKLEIERQTANVREAEHNLREGLRKTQAQIEQARADAQRENARLAGELERARLQLRIEQTYLELCEAELARGFEA